VRAQHHLAQLTVLAREQDEVREHPQHPARRDERLAQALEIVRRDCLIAPIKQRLGRQTPRRAVVEPNQVVNA
jgi:hypothetical protein